MLFNCPAPDYCATFLVSPAIAKVKFVWAGLPGDYPNRDDLFISANGELVGMDGPAKMTALATPRLEMTEPYFGICGIHIEVFLDLRSHHIIFNTMD